MVAVFQYIGIKFLLLMKSLWNSAKPKSFEFFIFNVKPNHKVNILKMFRLLLVLISKQTSCIIENRMGILW